MASVTGLTAERMQEIIDKTITDANIVADDLILTLSDATEINAGDVRGPQGDMGPAGSTSARVVALPGSPVDEQEISLDVGNGKLWHLKYNAGSASIYKWECMGASDLFAEALADETTTSQVYTSTGFTAISLLAPYAGEYMVEVGGTIWNDAIGVNTYMSFDIAGGGAADGDAIRFRQSNSAGNIGIITGARCRPKTIVAAGSVVVMRYKHASASGTSHFENRWMKLKPIRIG